MPTVYNRTTEAITRGTTPGGTDTLLYTAINIVRIGNTSISTDYSPSTDYNLSPSGAVDWSPLGVEPVANATYYVTYDYYPQNRLKTIDNVITDMRADVKINNPLIDISEGEIVNDIFIEVPAKQITDLYSTAEHIGLIQSLKNPDEFSTQEMNDCAYNYNLTRKPATTSVGFALFTARVAPVADIIIIVGTQISTLATSTTPSVTFQVTTSTVLLAGTYSVLVPIESVAVGVSNNVGANTISTLTTPISGVTGVTNPGATTGGTDQESNASLANRIINVWSGANIGTKQGIQNLMLAQNNVEMALVQGWGDPLMTRDNGYGGKVDVYIMAESNYSTPITDEETTDYGGGNIILAKQPVLSISGVKVNNVAISPSNYSLVKDSSGVGGSTRAQDAVSFSVPPSLHDDVRISYTYNSLIESLQALVDEDVNHIVTADVLIKSTVEVLVDMTFQISIQPVGSTFATVRDNVATALTNFINIKSLGAKILYSDMIGVARSVLGVVEVQVPFTLLARHGASGVGDITCTAKEFPRMGIPTITEI